jgi:hypothetical protein
LIGELILAGFCPFEKDASLGTKKKFQEMETTAHKTRITGSNRFEAPPGRPQPRPQNRTYHQRMGMQNKRKSTQFNSEDQFKHFKCHNPFSN